MRLVFKLYKGQRVQQIQGMRFREPGWAAIVTAEGRNLRVRRSELSPT